VMSFPDTIEEWATPHWFNFTVREIPHMPWLKPSTRKLIDNFEMVVNSRWPTVQDIRASKLSKFVLKALGSWRYYTRFYSAPVELRFAQNWIRLRKPKVESI
jgi:anaerobic magnesium-protoporphyrin IX monomethyl ester cyclase